jgi:hypothetical protein
VLGGAVGGVHGRGGCVSLDALRWRRGRGNRVVGRDGCCGSHSI